MKIDFLKEAYANKHLIKSQILSDTEWGFDRPIEEFIIGMTFINPQAYGSRIEKRVCKQFGFTKVKPVDNKGDYEDSFGDSYEIKASIIETSANQNLNLVQIRPCQDVSYLCIAFCISHYQDNSLSVKTHSFKLAKFQLLDEISLMGASSAHGTKNANKDNKNIELRLSLPINEFNPHYIRWKERYKTNITLK